MESTHCRTVKVFAHNLIHKKCAEHRRRQMLRGTIVELGEVSRCRVVMHSKFSLKNQRSFLESKLLRTILSTKDVQNRRRWRNRQVGVPGFAEDDVEINKLGRNQRAFEVSISMLTILSTAGVQNYTCRSAGNALHCRIRPMSFPL